MSYQKIRGPIEKMITDALVDAGLTTDYIFYDNVQYKQPDASKDYAVISLSFETPFVPTLMCGKDDIRGVVLVEIWTRANIGAATGESYGLEVLKKFCSQNSAQYGSGEDRIRFLGPDGPRLIAGEDAASHLAHNVSATFTGAIHT